MKKNYSDYSKECRTSYLGYILKTGIGIIILLFILSLVGQWLIPYQLSIGTCTFSVSTANDRIDSSCVLEKMKLALEHFELSPSQWAVVPTSSWPQSDGLYKTNKNGVNIHLRNQSNDREIGVTIGFISPDTVECVLSYLM